MRLQPWMGNGTIFDSKQLFFATSPFRITWSIYRWIYCIPFNSTWVLTETIVIRNADPQQIHFKYLTGKWFGGIKFKCEWIDRSFHGFGSALLPSIPPRRERVHVFRQEIACSLWENQYCYLDSIVSRNPSVQDTRCASASLGENCYLFAVNTLYTTQAPGIKIASLAIHRDLRRRVCAVCVFVSDWFCWANKMKFRVWFPHLIFNYNSHTKSNHATTHNKISSIVMDGWDTGCEIRRDERPSRMQCTTNCGTYSMVCI